MPSYCADTFTVPDLDYGYKRRRGDDATALYVVGGLVAVFLLMMPKRKVGYMQPVQSGMAAMRAAMAAVAGKDKDESQCTGDMGIDGKNVNCMGRKENDEVSPKQQKENEQKLKKYIRTHPNSILMLMAPWCSHCHSMLDLIASDVPGVLKDVEILIVNYQQLPPSLIDPNSADKMIACTHFPFFAVIGDKGEVKPSPSLPTAVEAAKEKAPEEKKDKEKKDKEKKDKEKKEEEEEDKKPAATAFRASVVSSVPLDPQEDEEADAFSGLF